MKRTGGSRRKTRHKFQKSRSQKGKISIRKYVQSFNRGDKVLLQIEPSVHKGMYFRRFHSKVGEIEAKRGSCYEISLKEGNKQKTVIVHPIHLTKCQK